jgi:hypothetical protein
MAYVTVGYPIESLNFAALLSKLSVKLNVYFIGLLIIDSFEVFLSSVLGAR